MKKSVLLSVLLVVAALAGFAEGPADSLFGAADVVAFDIPEHIGSNGELLLGAVSYNQLPVSLGDLFADLTANRLTGRSGFGTAVVKWYDNPDYPPGRASWLLSGSLYETGTGFVLTLQLVDNSSGAQLAGWDFTMDPVFVESLLAPSIMADMAAWDAYEPNDRPDEAPLVSLPFSAEGLNLGEGDEDWFAFEVGSPGGDMIQLLRARTTGATDTYLELYSPDDTEWPVAENDDYDGGNALIEMPLAVPGIWYLKVRAYDSATSGEYGLDLSMESTLLGPGEPDEGTDAASTLSVGRPPTRKQIDYTGDEDWFRIVLTRPLGREEVLRIETLSDIDTTLTILDEFEGFIMSDDDSGAQSNAMAMVTGIGPGTYYAVVSGYEGTVGEYSIMANITVPVRDDYEDDNSMSQASRIAPGESQRRNFSPVGDVDWVTFTLPEPGTYSIRTTGNLDTFMELYDESGNLLEENDDAEDYNAEIINFFQAGDYFVLVTPYGNVSPDDVYSLVLEKLE